MAMGVSQRGARVNGRSKTLQTFLNNLINSLLVVVYQNG
jgi:hypothetical protein